MRVENSLKYLSATFTKSLCNFFKSPSRKGVSLPLNRSLPLLSYWLRNSTGERLKAAYSIYLCYHWLWRHLLFFLWLHNCIFSLYISFHAVNTFVLLFINFVNPPLEFGSYKRAVYAQVSVAFRFPFTYFSLRLGIHKFLLFRYNSFFRKLLQICPYLSQAHTLCPLALQYAELSPKSKAFLQFRHLTYTISGLTFFGILMVTSAFF